MHDWIQPVIFYAFAALVLLSGLMVVVQNNPVRCVLFLVLTFFGSAVLWMLTEAEFLSLILVLVYVGAVMTLFLFVVMMLNIDVESRKSRLWRYLPFGLIVIALLTALLMIAMPEELFDRSTQSPRPFEYGQQVADRSEPVKALTNTEQIGMVIYTDYVYAFELAAALLLVAIIAAITLAHRNMVRSKRQNVKQQIMTERASRVILINLKSEK